MIILLNNLNLFIILINFFILMSLILNRLLFNIIFNPKFLRRESYNWTFQLRIYIQNSAIIIKFITIIGRTKNSNNLLIKTELISILYNLMRPHNKLNIIGFTEQLYDRFPKSITRTSCRIPKQSITSILRVRPQ